MGELIKWWVIYELIGWIAFPICFAFFKNLYSKGYSFSKIAGLLFWGYIYWVGNTFGIIGNSRLGAVFSLIVILSLSILLINKKIHWSELVDWIKEHTKIIIYNEILFLLAIIFMVIMRGANPEIIGTEKPMELTFINGILRSPSFPPSDPWLSGYSISYYYFGYLIIAAVIKIIGTDSGIAFNLALVFWFALASVGVFEILFNIIAGKIKHDNKSISRKKENSVLLLGLLGPLFLLIMSNGEGFLELLHSLGFLWKPDSNGEMASQFWRWLDIKELTQPPPIPFDWYVGRIGGTWWWRASRVLQDYSIQGASLEIIDEFPFFSFFLGDLHPHLLAMPFVLLCIISGYAYFLEVKGKKTRKLKSLIDFWKRGFNWFFALILGSLLFFNTWDFPIYFGMAGMIFFVSIYLKKNNFRETLKESAILLLTLGICCMVLYSPFLLSFSSQAGGFSPSLIFQSRGIHLFVMFLPFIMIILLDSLARVYPYLPRLLVGKSILIIFGGYLLSVIFSMIIPLFVETLPEIYKYVQSRSGMNIENSIQQSIQNSQAFISIYGASNTHVLVLETINRIISDPIDILIMIILISIMTSLLVYFVRLNGVNKGRILFGKEDAFIGILVILAISLILVPEVFYLRDQFGWRMNTIFKFYFQSWILLSICAAYMVSRIYKNQKLCVKIIISSFTLLSIVLGLVYPCYAFKERVDSLVNRELTLNGNEYLQTSNPDEYEAVRFLEQVPYGVISEAVGGSYTNFSRISKLTGLPTVLGWPGHEMQWRGGVEEIGSRESDIKELYSANNWSNAKNILDKYKIRYIYIGDIERMSYHVSDKMFEMNLPIIFKNSDITIYEYDEYKK